MRINTTRYAILGLLREGPKSGYDIKRASETGTCYFWQENFGAIYPMLRRLEQEGLVRGETAGQGRRPRRVFRITPAGEAALDAWLARPPQPTVLRDELLLKIFFGRVAVGHLIRHVQACREEYRQRQNDLEAIARTLRVSTAPEAPFRLITVHRGIRRALAYLAWCDETLDVLRRLGSGPEHEVRVTGSIPNEEALR